MIDKETYKKELMRMFASFRGDSAKFEYCFCRYEQCDECPLLDCCHMHGMVRPYDVFEVIEKVEKWSKEHQPKKYQVSRMEYDILQEVYSIHGNFRMYQNEIINNLREKGYFKGSYEDTEIEDYLKSCEVDE